MRGRTRRVILAVAVVAVAATVGSVALYASTTDDTGGTPSAGQSPSPTAVPATGQASQPAARPTSSPTPSVPALWQQEIASASPLLTPAALLADPADVPTVAGLAQVLNPALAAPVLAGDDVAIVVTSAASGQLLFSHDAVDAVAPASTAKLAVAVAALTMLGPDHRFDTAVRQGPHPGELVLVGGGDPTLAGPTAVGALGPGYPTPASLPVLASKTVSQLQAQGVTTVSVGYDATLFVGPQLAPGWKPIYQTEGDVAPVSALEVDEGSQDLTKPGRTANPAAAAAAAFAALLTAGGITVVGVPRAEKAPATPVTIAAVQSPPLYQLVQRMLGRSDNDLAEALARQVAIARGLPASFAGGARAVKETITALGVDPARLAMVDASGLSPLDRAKPGALAQLVRLAIAPGHDQLTSIFTGLPVAGFYGTLGDRFAGPAAAGLGVIRAKTGTLNGVVSLAGYLDDASGATLVFVVIANGVKLNATAATEVALDRVVASLPGCGCH